MDLDFEWCELGGTVHVDCETTTDPESLGVRPEAVGFPACTATVEFPHLGYRALFGWVQLVRSTDNSSGGEHFELDPFVLFEDAPTPYCWYGTRPTLFDAPARQHRSGLRWEAHSFLATTPLAEVVAGSARRVVPLVGFTWGFEASGGVVASNAPTRLGTSDWNSHLTILRSRFPSWKFEPAEPTHR